jgi:hypothetical protein
MVNRSRFKESSGMEDLAQEHVTPEWNNIASQRQITDLRHG